MSLYNKTDAEIKYVSKRNIRRKKYQFSYRKSKKEVKEFLECLVRIWCLTTPEKSFTCSELLNNADWEKKPLCYMYNYYKNKGESDEEAKNHDSVDIGWLLLEVILEMPQKFRAKRIFRKTYTYIPE
ncbi:MAG: hypothetical protein MSH22_13585 [Spirochaetia bacterium]|nr:hypothetical protein [Spirochaetia bacterium]